MVKDGIVLGKRYEVLSKIGAGGMADVYKGKDTMLNRYVAIKVLKKEYREDEKTAPARLASTEVIPTVSFTRLQFE